MTPPLLRCGAALAAAIALLPNLAAACACGCGVFSVGADALNPTLGKGEISLDYDHMDQNQDWFGHARAPAADNADKEIKTDFFTLTGQYRLSPTWTVRAEIPLWSRTFRTENAAGTGVNRFQHAALGDVRLMGVWSGLARDGSTGLVFGVKLPTGDFKYPGFDRDTEIGTGGTDLLIGAYHGAPLDQLGRWTWFAQTLGDLPIASRGGYAQGREADAAVGLAWHGLSAPTAKFTVTPTLQVIGSLRGQDSGPKSNAGDSGYRRALISPGVEIASGAWRVYGDVELPLYQHYNGHQLAAPVLIKVRLSRGF